MIKSLQYIVFVTISNNWPQTCTDRFVYTSQANVFEMRERERERERESERAYTIGHGKRHCSLSVVSPFSFPFSWVSESKSQTISMVLYASFSFIYLLPSSGCTICRLRLNSYFETVFYELIRIAQI